MAKSIKLKNNTYIDSTGVDYKHTNLETTLDTITTNITSLLSRDYIVGQGTNENGTYIKWNNGLQICYKTMTYNGINCNTAWGSLYESTRLSIGNFANPFISTPIISLTPNNPFFVEKYGNTSSTSFGDWYMVRPKSGSAGDNAILYCFAIGMWK